MSSINTESAAPTERSAAAVSVVPGAAAAIDAPARALALAGGRVRVAAAVAASLALAGVSVVLAASSDHVEHPTATALYYGHLVAASLLVGLYWSVRRPSSTFGPLLALFGVTTWVVSWQSSDWALAFDFGVLAEGVFFVLTFYLFLAFPSGRLRTFANRALVVTASVAALAFFVPWALLTPVIAGAGPLSGCEPACPANVLQVGTDPAAVEFFGRWETYAMLALVLAILGVYWRRIATASRPQRRALIAVAVSSLLFLPIFFVYHFSNLILHAGQETLEPMAWALIGIRVIMPLGFLAALFQAELFAGAARGRLLEELMRRPSPERWRDAVASALDDPPAQIAFWDPAADRYREADGSELAPPPAGRGRSWVQADDRSGQPVAAMVLDDALAEDPELVRAATSATVLAVENGNLEGELRATQLRAQEARAAERRRIEGNLHDSAQQRLVALRIKLALAGETLHGPQQEAIQHLGAEVEHALEEVRGAASGTPPVLRRHGVATALRLLARSAAIPVSVTDRGFDRRSDPVESAVYFCCAEALQNASKHAGPTTGVEVTLSHDGDGWVQFSVEDDGVGFDPDSVLRGRGLDNMSDRVAAVGGRLDLDSAAGHGTRIRGRVPANA